MATNLVVNVKNALKDLPEPTVYGWLDSTVALHWILGNGLYRQFVTNRVQKINNFHGFSGDTYPLPKPQQT